MDFWRDVTDAATPVDIRVPTHSLKSVKMYLEGHGILYTVMIEDLQALLDEEQEAMEASARFAQPRTTKDFDYANYHTVEEVRTHTHKLPPSLMSMSLD